MMVRLGFVSNSSSSSFIIKGINQKTNEKVEIELDIEYDAVETFEKVINIINDKFDISLKLESIDK
jgi:phosphomevalonate kinase